MKKTIGNRKSSRRQQQQGDVCLDLVTLPQNVKIKEGRVILAFGEVTGHVHEVLGNNVIFYEDEETMYVVVKDEPATLIHEEHHVQTLDITPTGMAWRRRIVREYDHFREEARRVID